MTRILVADIGGTNSRFAVAERTAGRAGVTLQQLRNYENADFSSLHEVLHGYLNALDKPAPAHACLAVAGPNDGRSGYMINLNWKLDAAALERESPLQQVWLVNDFAALAASLPTLASTDVQVLYRAEPGPGPRAVLGPGTGLGVAALLPVAGAGPMVLSTEGGHMSLAPGSALEQEFCDYLTLTTEVEYRCAETVLSGTGLLRLYRFLCQRAGRDAEPLSPSTVTARALAGSDAHCSAAIAHFLAMLGAVAGDIALVQGATGGVYLGGGILPRILPLVADSELIPRFQAKGPLRAYMEKIPVNVITADTPALLGAALLLPEPLPCRPGF